jgi:hypothetical protein
MGWGNNDGSADVDGGAVGGTAGNASGPGPGEAEGTGFGGEIGGYSGYGGGAGVGPHGTQAAGPTMGMMDQAADMNAAAMAGGLVDSAGGMEFGGQGVVGSQGNVAGSQHAGTAGDSFSDAVAALDAAIGSMPNLEPGGITYGMEQATAPPSTGLPGMGYGGVTNENFDPMGSSHMGQFGQGTGIAAPGQTFGPGAAAPSGVMSALGTPNLGWGDDPFGDTMAPTNTVDPGLQSAVATGQAPGTDVGMPGYGALMSQEAADVGMPGYAASMQAQAEAQEADEVGADLAAQGQAQTESMATEEHDVDKDLWGNLTKAEKQASYDARQQALDDSRAATAAEEDTAGPQVTGDEQEMEDVDQDLSGMPTGMTAEQTNMIVAGLKDAEKGKGFAYALNEIARAYLGLPKSTPESRMKDALSNYDAQGKQDQMEMDVSTGEDDKIRRAKLQAVSDFRKKYKWAANMSPKEIQAYIDNPALLNLKTSNEQMKSMDPKNMTANDIRQLWSPAMSA